MPSPFRRKTKEKDSANLEDDSDLEEVVEAEEPIDESVTEIENLSLIHI